MHVKSNSQIAALILGSLSWRLDGTEESAELCHDDAVSAFRQQRFDACIRRAIKGLAYVNPQAAQRAERIRDARCIRA